MKTTGSRVIPEHDARGRETRERILDTAEALFAREGVTAVTLRSIAAAAEVNVAAVNYYFGSKEKLFDEMFLRRIAPLNDERLARLEAAQAAAPGGNPSLAAIVEAYVLPAAETTAPNARAIVAQYSLGRILAMPGANRMLVRHYDRLRTAYVAALEQALPHLARHEIVWRYYWMGGALMCALAVPPGMIEAPSPDAGEVHAVAADLVAFLVQGFLAEATERRRAVA